MASYTALLTGHSPPTVRLLSLRLLSAYCPPTPAFLKVCYDPDVLALFLPPIDREISVTRLCFHAVRVSPLVAALALFSACSNRAQTSVAKAREHVQALVELTVADVAEVRSGLPQGAEQLSRIFEPAARAARDAGEEDNGGAPAAEPAGAPLLDFQTAREALERARSRVQDLRVAKSTFFALVGLDGVVIRSDGDQDLLAGKSLYASFPELRALAPERYVETRGSMPEVAGVRGRSDGQWVAAHPVKSDGKTRAVYATGWSWAAYAYRLETALRSRIISELGPRENLPLLYVYVVVDGLAQGAPISPEINGAAILETAPLEHTGDGAVFARVVSIDERDFGLAVMRAPELGKDVALAVLRSEV